LRDEIYADIHNEYYNLFGKTEKEIDIDIDNLNDDLEIQHHLENE
jgi:hypothetical protein